LTGSCRTTIPHRGRAETIARQAKMSRIESRKAPLLSACVEEIEVRTVCQSVHVWFTDQRFGNDQEVRDPVRSFCSPRFEPTEPTNCSLRYRTGSCLPSARGRGGTVAGIIQHLSSYAVAPLVTAQSRSLLSDQHGGFATLAIWGEISPRTETRHPEILLTSARAWGYHPRKAQGRNKYP
jgi:hypothetical protein